MFAIQKSSHSVYGLSPLVVVLVQVPLLGGFSEFSWLILPLTLCSEVHFCTGVYNSSSIGVNCSHIIVRK